MNQRKGDLWTYAAIHSPTCQRPCGIPVDRQMWLGTDLNEGRWSFTQGVVGTKAFMEERIRGFSKDNPCVLYTVIRVPT